MTSKIFKGFNTFEIILNADMVLPLPYQKNNRNSSSSQLLASFTMESSESSSINETTAALYATAIFFSFLNLARDSADALYNFAPAVHYYVLYITIVVTDPMN